MGATIFSGSSIRLIGLCQVSPNATHTQRPCFSWKRVIDKDHKTMYSRITDYAGTTRAFLKPFDTSFHSDRRPLPLKYIVHQDVFDPFQLSPTNHVPVVGAEESTGFPVLHYDLQRSTSSHAMWGLQGLSKYQQSILSKTLAAAYQRQALMTGRDPLTLSVRDSPTLKWLFRSSKATDGVRQTTSQLYVNGTALAKSSSSWERFSWLLDPEDDDGWFDVETRQDQIQDTHDYYSMEWVAEIHLTRPGYLQILPRDTVASILEENEEEKASGLGQWSWNNDTDFSWQGKVRKRFRPDNDVLVCTGFSLASSKGFLATFDTHRGGIASASYRTTSQLLWPNEVAAVPKHIAQAPETSKNVVDRPFRSALLVSDGFLVPGKHRGGLYLVQHPGNPDNECTTRLTAASSSWFYHKSVWIDLTNDGRQSILTARCRVTTNAGATNIVQQGQLVWLEAPKPDSYDTEMQLPLEDDGTPFDPFARRHLPWKERVLATGPDVML
eukprot:scaffold5885_cov201-Amphora_coffeaeformis.AAC.19